jgi:hypothetical protein
MRRDPVFLLVLMAIAAMAAPQMASAQAVTPFKQLGQPAIFGSTVDPPTSPAIVIARLMTFDRDNDGRLVKSELPERMQNLLAGDSSGDQALDRDEILAMARPAPPAPVAAATVTGFRGGGGGSYTFGDQVSLSTRSHVEGALDDLKLTSIPATAGAGDRPAIHGSSRGRRGSGAREGTRRPGRGETSFVTSRRCSSVRCQEATDSWWSGELTARRSR